MALRSRSRTATPTSGPGRGPVSDGRTRHRPPSRPRPHPRGRSGTEIRRHDAPAEALRLRARALFPESGREEGESGHGPPVVDRDVGAPRARTSAGLGVAEGWGGDRSSRADGGPSSNSTSSQGGSPRETDGRVGTGVPAYGAEPGWRHRAGLAVRERLPLWLQSRCGLERRSVVALGVLLVVAAVFAVQHFWTGRTQQVRAPEEVRAVAPFGGGEASEGGSGATDPSPAAGGPAGPVNSAGPAGAEIVVDVSGKVRGPGLRRLPAGSRVEDALRAAGGVRPGANTEGLNRARLLVDGEQVVVGAPAPVAGTAMGGGSLGGGGGGVGGAGSGAAPTAPVSLNTATVDQLDTLPGVGPVLARHIVEYRTEHGGFRSVDELREVNGIGDRRFADLQNLVRP
ncbi:helix-hairpin-helix domain-containing protein [Streptomyces sp. NPDC088736]|uniref:helix-hairpin-helix domain-containing protein n=1 Tax=Streptomyces sp. NPDC088736 TaxID=3365881 RepID=UPI0037FF76B6